MKKITFNLSLNSKKIILKLFLILFLSIIFSFKAFSLPQVLILKNSFNSGGYTYHVFDVYDGQIYRGIRITYTGQMEKVDYGEIIIIGKEYFKI